MLTNWISTITSAFTEFLDATGSGIVDFFKVMVIQSSVGTDGVRTFSTTGELTTLATVGLIGFGISVALGIINWARRKVSRAR